MQNMCVCVCVCVCVCIGRELVLTLLKNESLMRETR